MRATAMIGRFFVAILLGFARMTSAIGRFFAAIRAAGNPKDQIEFFLKAGIVLQPRQLEASAAARACDRDGGPTEVGFGGARGGGKSYWAIAQAADDCMRFPGLNVLLLRKVGTSNKENFENLRRRLLLRLPHRYVRSEGVLTFANGSRIVIGHFQHEKDVDKYLGLEYDVIVVEEATTLTKAKYDDVGSCLRTSKLGWRPRMYLTTNPGNVGHAWFKARFVGPFAARTQTDTRYVPATIADNAYVNREYRGRLERLVGWKRRAWLLGDWDIAAGQFFTTFRRDVHVIKPFPIPEGWKVWLALDYGFTHFTAAYLFAQAGDGQVFVVDEHAERGWLVPRHARALDAMLARHGIGKHRLDACVAGADVFSKRHNGGTVAEDYRECGYRLRAANDDRINGAAEVLSRLGDVDATPRIAPTLLIFDRCARLAECLPALQHDPHRPEDVLKVDCDDDGQGGDDFYDAARYGVMYVAGKRKLTLIS